MRSKLILLVALVFLSACAAATAPIRVPVGQVVQWDYHPAADCEPAWHTSNIKVAFVAPDVANPYKAVVLGRKEGRSVIRLICGGVTYTETVEVFSLKEGVR